MEEDKNTLGLHPEVREEDRVAKAVALFREGYNCPRAPESDMMKIGLSRSASNSSLTIPVTSSLTSFHNLITAV